MPFTLQHLDSGLFWTSGIFGRVQLGTVPNVYTLEGAFIKNVNTGNYVNHMANILHEGGAAEEFVFGVDGSISTKGQFVTSGTFLTIGGEATKWVKVDEVEDVPVARSAALIEEALNSNKVCPCECEVGCDGCDCEDCDCSKTQ